MFAARARLLLVTFWVGSLWTIGYLVAPALFLTLPDRALAGTIAGSLFRVEAWVSIVCGTALIVLIAVVKDQHGRTTRKTCLYLALGILAGTLMGYFGLQPFMAALRETSGPGGVMDAAAKTRFGILHGLSSGIYLIQSLLGVALVLKMRTLELANN
ncbi:MAG: DUF4149 domain-containing protein [Pseudomonadota bacterium]